MIHRTVTACLAGAAFFGLTALAPSAHADPLSFFFDFNGITGTGAYGAVTNGDVNDYMTNVINGAQGLNGQTVSATVSHEYYAAPNFDPNAGWPGHPGSLNESSNIVGPTTDSTITTATYSDPCSRWHHQGCYYHNGSYYRTKSTSTSTINGDLPDGNYNNEYNHVVPLTLGNTDFYGTSAADMHLTSDNSNVVTDPDFGSTQQTSNKADNYLTNVGYTVAGVGGETDHIDIDFSHLIITNLSFDVEIFPCYSGDYSCNGSTLPDFHLEASSADGTTHLIEDTIQAMDTGGTYCHSPASGVSTCEQLNQNLFHLTYTFTDAQAISNLAFYDWNDVIGIDNLYVDYAPPTQTPEPATFAIFGFGLAGLGFMRRRRKRAA